MKIENQVCTLGQAKRLFELGIRDEDPRLQYVEYETKNGGETALSFSIMDGVWSWVIVQENISDALREQGEALEDCGPMYPAYTVAELGVMLPHELRNGVFAPDMFTVIPPSQGTEYNWCIAYIPLGNSIQDECKIYCDGNTEAEARAAMLIYLLENNLTSAAEINECLNAA